MAYSCRVHPSGRTFRHTLPIYSSNPPSLAPFTLDSRRSAQSQHVSMSINSIDLQNTLSNILLRLDELDRKIDNMNRNLDLLLTQSNPNNVLGGYNPLATGHISWNDPSFGGMNGRSST